MNLHEYQAKRLLADHGIPVPEGLVAESAAEARAAAERLGGRVAVKAQVLVGGRGKAGGVVLAESADEAAQAAGRLLGQPMRGWTVGQVLVERRAEIEEELYLGLALDRSARCMRLIASSAGGVGIEETARVQPASIHTTALDPLVGLRPYHANGAAAAIGLRPELWRAWAGVAQALYAAAQATDATLAEINPLVVTPAGTLLALDAKVTLDDNALFRHPDLAAL
ncbi:MAG: ATP-grasp domain-containing protein, partial [Chloroflexota bacterium]